MEGEKTTSSPLRPVLVPTGIKYIKELSIKSYFKCYEIQKEVPTIMKNTYI